MVYVHELVVDLAPVIGIAAGTAEHGVEGCGFEDIADAQMAAIDRLGAVADGGGGSVDGFLRAVVAVAGTAHKAEH